MRMRNKLLVFFFPMALLFIGGMSLLTRRVVLGVIEQEVIKREIAAVSATVQDPVLVAGVRARDESLLLPLLQDLVADGQGAYALVQDAGGRVLAHTNVVERGKVYDDPVTLESMASDIPVHRLSQTNEGPMLDVAVPVWVVKPAGSEEAFLLMGKDASGNRTRLGAVRLGVSMREPRATADHISGQVSGVLALGGTLFIVLALVFNRQVLKPIRLLAEATEQVRQGELGKRVPVLSHDEIGDLAKSFNRMSQNLAETSVSKDFLDSILGNMMDALIATTPDGRIRMVNRSALDLLGYDEIALIHQPVGRVLDGPAQVIFVDEGDADVRRDLEGHFICRDGGRIPVLLSVSAPRDRERFGGVIITAKDMRERLQAEETRRQMERHLVQSERMAAVGTVAAGIVHNLRNPLTGILGFAELLKIKHPDLTEADRILSSATLMNGMIENILSKSRQKRTVEPLDLNRLIERELDFLMADRVFKRDVTKQIALAEHLPSIQGVYTEFSQVFGNLLRNAIEAMHDCPDKTLRVTTAREADRVVVEIADTGCGIAERDLPHLFVPFFTTKTGKDGPQGTGLGLYTAKRLLETYKATLTVESIVDRGTAFRVAIPMALKAENAGEAT